MGLFSRAARIAAITILGALFWVMVGLEAVYLWWLPSERPTRTARPLPSLVRGAIWAEFGGRGRPRLDPQIPFLIPLVLASSNPVLTRQHALPLLVSRNALPRMSQLEFTARSIALTTWISRHWTTDEVIDAVGSHAWMGAAGEGLEAGARYYWRRGLDDLAPHEVATLIAVMQSPRGYDPACRPERALRGRRIALERMHDAGVIDEIAFRQAMAAPMLVAPACDRPPEAETHRSPPAAPCYR